MPPACKALALEGRLLLGPWYLQPDEFLVGGESLIRNLQRGSPYRRSPMAAPCRSATCPIPSDILASFHSFCAASASTMPSSGEVSDPEIKKDAFRWQAPDGSEVLVAWL